MKQKELKPKNILVLLLLCLLLFFIISLANNQAGAVTASSEEVAPLPPTPGSPPTSEPYKPEGREFVDNADEAIRLALLVDSDWAIREKPLTADMVTANDNVTVEYYPSRQEAEAVYLGGGSPLEDVASEPVWVVRIRGDVLVRVVGGPRRDGTDPEPTPANGVTYIILQQTGELAAVSASAQTRAERLGVEP